MKAEIIIILIINGLLTILYLFRCYKDGNSKGYVFALFFLAAPILGLMIFVIPYYMAKITKRQDSIDSDDLISKKVNETYISRPKVNKELNIIPFEEALRISSVTEKRGLLLDILKDDMVNNYNVAKTALDDSDSETSHYAAAASMEVSKNLREQIQSVEAEYIKQRDIPLIRRVYIDSLYNYLNIGVLSGRDRKITLDKYKVLIDESMENYESMLIQKDYVHLMTFLIETGDLYEAEKIGTKRLEVLPDEELYEKLLEIYYIQKNQPKFIKTLQGLQNSKIVLSAKGLEMVRFWINKG